MDLIKVGYHGVGTAFYGSFARCVACLAIFLLISWGGVTYAVGTDTDLDGMDDAWEVTHFSDLSHSGGADSEGDGLTDLQEYQLGTDPNNPDTDGDKISDGYEVSRGTSPTNAADTPPIPIAWSVYNVNTSGGSPETQILVWILAGFTGTLPGDIDTITLTGPGGSLPYTKNDFIFKTFPNPPSMGLAGCFILTIPGLPPALGQYTVNVTSGTSESGIQKDVQTVNRSIPIVDAGSFSPADNATVVSKTPHFTWKGIDYSEAPVFYQLMIQDTSGNYIYFSSREKIMAAWTLPVGTLTPGQTYKWRVSTSDDSDFNRIQNRSISDWHTFTMANTLTHSAPPAIDGGSTLGVTTWSDGGSTNLLFWASVTDHDGVASDGSSHQLKVTYPNGTTTISMYAHALNSKAYLFDGKQIRTDTKVFYMGFANLQGNPATPGIYSFEVIDPDGNVGTMQDTLVVDPLSPPDVGSLSPSSASEQITAYFDNVNVNGVPFDDFSGYADISQLDPSKWNPPCGNASIDNGKVKITQANVVGGSSCDLSLKNPGAANSIQADVAVSSISSNAAKARVYGWFYNNGNGDVFAEISVRENLVSYGVYEFLIGDSFTFHSIGSGDLISIALDQTATVSISWNGSALTFNASSGGVSNQATFTPTGPVFPLTRFFSKGMGARIVLGQPNTTPKFTIAPVTGANQYSMRFYDHWNDYVISNIYSGNAPSLQVPPGMLNPNTFYYCEIRVQDAHEGLDVSNYAKAPVQTFEINTGDQAVDPFIDFDRSGVATFNNPLFGSHLSFWVNVSDAQGVPGNIKSVKVLFPDGTTEETLNYATGNPYDAWNRKTAGYYYVHSYLPITAGTYTFKVEDQEGHSYTTTDDLTLNPIGYPSEASIVPAPNAVIGSTAVNFDWDAVPGAAFYRLNIYNEYFERLYALSTTESQYSLAAGFLKAGTLHRFEIRTYREFFDQNIDNGSSTARQFPWMPTFFTTGVTGGTHTPTIDTHGEGVSVWHTKNPATGADMYALNFNAEITDGDGVPGNIQEVAVTFPAPNTSTKKSLIYRANPNKGSNWYFYPEFYSDYTQIPTGTYTFTVTDFDGKSAQTTADLTEVNPLPLVTGCFPADNADTSIRPLITWNAVAGAASYQVRIYDSSRSTLLHSSGFLPGTSYLVPAGVLTANTSYCYMVVAFRGTQSGIDVQNPSVPMWQPIYFKTSLPLGSISGFVLDDQQNPISGASVYIADYTTGQGMGGATSGANGSYTIPNLTAGQYRVDAWATGHVRNWWKDTLWHHQATPVSVTDGQATPNISFKLAPGGTISGIVKDGADAPITGVQINVDVYTGNPCSSIQYVSGSSTNVTNGTYSITGIPVGTGYYLRTWNNGAPYMNEWWASASSSPNCANAEAVAVTAGGTVNANFNLDASATISGTVRDSGGAPITGKQIKIYVYSGDPCGSHQWITDGYTNTSNGTYTIGGAPPGTYYLVTNNMAQSNYVNEWWASTASTSDCSKAETIIIAGTESITDKNFQLDVGATISGSITNATGTPLANVWVNAYGSKCWGNHLGWSQTDANGAYTISGLPAGGSYIVAEPPGSQLPYAREWWDGNVGTSDCNQAVAVTLAAQEQKKDINFALSDAGAISGKVTDLAAQPIAGVSVTAWPYYGGVSWSTATQADGTYTLYGIPPGKAKVRAQAIGTDYAAEYYNDIYDSNLATPVNVVAKQTIQKIDFSMGKYGSISGTVFDSDGSTPLPNVCVGAFFYKCGSNITGAAKTGGDGTYKISGLPPKDYYVRTDASCAATLHYTDQWWSGTVVCDQATPVTVASAAETKGINFLLPKSPTVYPAPSYSPAGVFSAHNANGSIATTLFAFIKGPSPEDVVSVTAKGPGGKDFNLGLNPSVFKQLGNFYIVSVPVIEANGAYTFEVKDSIGRTTKIDKPFTYDGAVPQVDSATMKVAGKDTYAYVGTTTPTFTWGAVTWPDPAKPGSYQLFVWDYDGRAIWYVETTQATSVTIPDGYLRSDTPYYWYIRSMDASGENRRYSNTLYFYTGAEGQTPDVSKNLPYASTDPNQPAGSTWFGVSKVNLAPWDIADLRVVGPDGTVYPNNNHRSWFFDTSMWYFCWSTWPVPIPDGTYTYEVKDKASNTYTADKGHTYQFVPPISEGSRFPADNAYLYTKSPTFSWAAPTTGTFYYSLRILDYNGRVRWYSSSPNLNATTFTLPEAFVQTLPPGSYKWQVRVYKDNGAGGCDDTNAAISSDRTFTIPPLDTTPYALPGGTGLQTDYRLFSVPFYMGTGNELKAAMEKQLGTYDNTLWRVFAWNGADHVELSQAAFQSLPIVPGSGFWIISLSSPGIEFEGGKVADGAVYKMKLAPGWHIIGLPWKSTSINLGNMAVSDGTNTYSLTDPNNFLTQPCVWDYVGAGGAFSGYEKRDQSTFALPCGTGFWLKVIAGSPVTLLIPPDNSAGYFSPQSFGTFQSIKGGRVVDEELPPAPPGG